MPLPPSAEEHMGQLLDHLLPSNRSPSAAASAILAHCRAQRAVDGLLQGLMTPAAALAAIASANGP